MALYQCGLMNSPGRSGFFRRDVKGENGSWPLGVGRSLLKWVNGILAWENVKLNPAFLAHPNGPTEASQISHVLRQAEYSPTHSVLFAYVLGEAHTG